MDAGAHQASVGISVVGVNVGAKGESSLDVVVAGINVGAEGDKQICRPISRLLSLQLLKTADIASGMVIAGLALMGSVAVVDLVALLSFLP